MKLKCLFGFHDWGTETFTRFTYTRKCKRCGKQKTWLLPWELVLNVITMEIIFHSSVVASLLLSGKKDVAENYVTKLVESVRKGENKK